jgi:hypothetical protein
MIVGLYSPAPRCGKTTIAEYLRSAFGFKRVRFAGPLKAMATALFTSIGFDEDEVYRMVEGDKKDLPVPGFEFRPRDIMQTLGTDWGREMMQKDLWIKSAVARIERLTDAGYSVVVDDLRFPNEYAALRDLGARLVHVRRPGVTGGSERYEGQLDDAYWDLKLLNDGEIDDLYDVIASYIRMPLLPENPYIAAI